MAVSSAGSGQQSPSTEGRLRGPRHPKMRLNQSAKPGDRGSQELTSLLFKLLLTYTRISPSLHKENTTIKELEVLKNYRNGMSFLNVLPLNML